MKKILAALLSLALCTAMFTACGKDTETAEVSDVTTTAAAETTEKAAETTAAETTEKAAEEETTAETTEAAEAETTTAETTEKATEAETTAAETTATEAETEAEAKTASYASLKEFVKSGDTFKLDTTEIPAGDSLTYDWVRIFEGAEGIYMDVEYFDDSMAMVMGMEQDKMYMYMKEAASGTNMTIILNGGKMYMLDEATKTGYSMTADESIMDEYDIEAMLGDIDFDAETENAEDVKVAKIEIDGKEYTLEIADTGGAFLFDKNEKITAIIAEEDGAPIAIKVNEFSGDTPDELFEVPSGYEIIDIDAAQ